jgi:hypothetical protein
MVRSLRFRYVPRVYRATSPLADMNQRAAYDGCVRQGAQGFCQDRLRSWKYRLVLPRDRGLDVAVSADASTAVVYAFGDLHVYDLRAGELSLVRTVRDVFYADADHFTLWPKVVISRTGRWAALRGTWRLVRVVELASGTTRAWFDHQGIADPWPLAQRRSWAPTAWGAITAPEDGLMLLDRAGQVQSIALSGLNDPRPLRSHGQGDPLSASRLLRYQDTLVLWSNSSLRLVRLGSGALIRKLGWEVLPEGFDAPRVAQYVKDRTRWFESPSSPTF